MLQPSSSGLSALYAGLSATERAELEQLIAADIVAHPWRPLIDLDNPDRPTPQQQAYDSLADILLFGGAAGGGKSDLICGLAVTSHKRALVLRREVKQLQPIIDRLGQILRSRDGWNGQRGRWALPDGRIIDLGGCSDPGSEQAYQGAPHDLIAFDETAQFLEQQFRFLLGWNRSVDPNQRCRVVCASNPPATAEGQWIKEFWSPWLNDTHANPALPGELRWFIMTEDGDREVDGPAPVSLNGELLIPRSRTFIPSSVDDNPFLSQGSYKSVLMGMPEPLRSQMLRGDFTATGADDPWQVCPSGWVRDAQSRWREGRRPEGYPDALGVDPAAGGRDDTVLSRRRGDWFDALVVQPGGATPDGGSVAALVVANMKERCPVYIDVIGIGLSAYEHLKGNGLNVVAVDSRHESGARDRSGQLGFANKRAELWWRMREALEPNGPRSICLPPDPRLLADLCAPRWKLTPQGIRVELKEETRKRLGRSPDRADAVILAMDGGRRDVKMPKIKYPQIGIR
jgi:hypothetical protein